MTTPCETVIERAPARPVSTPSSDQEFVQRLQAGDDLAYRRLIERYQLRVLRLAYGILRSREEADEIAQMVFVKVFLSIKNFAGRSSLFAWIYRIAANECYSALRKRGIEVSIDASDPHDPCGRSLRTCPQPGSPFDAVLLQRNYLNRLLSSVPEHDRHLLLLREVEGLSMSELAETTGMNENTVKIRLFRARQRLVKAAKLRTRRQIGNAVSGRICP